MLAIRQMHVRAICDAVETTVFRYFQIQQDQLSALVRKSALIVNKLLSSHQAKIRTEAFQNEHCIQINAR